MPSKMPFGPEQIVIQSHSQYSLHATNGLPYRVNAPLTLFHFQDGMPYTVSGSISTKGNRYISEIVGGTAPPVAQPSVQQPGLPPLPPAPPNYTPPVAPIASPPPPIATPVPPPVSPATPPPFKKDNVEGKVACAVGAGLVQYLASTSKNEAEFLASYKQLLPQILDYHREKGWM